MHKQPGRLLQWYGASCSGCLAGVPVDMRCQLAGCAAFCGSQAIDLWLLSQYLERSLTSHSFAFAVRFDLTFHCQQSICWLAVNPVGTPRSA